MESLTYLCYLVIFLLVAVGVLLVAVLVVLSRRKPVPPTHPTAPSQEPEDRCARCGARLDRRLPRCPECGLRSQSVEDRELRRLAVTSELLRELVQEGKIDALVLETVERSLRERRDALAGRRSRLAPEAPAARREQPVAPAQDVLDVLPAWAEPAGEESAPALVAPVTMTPIPPEPPVTRPRRRSLGEMLSGFMEEKNILWGEIVGGLLIVGCSVALVISLWQTLKGIPYFPFLVIAASTAAMFGAGLYTLHRWRLESTSRGLLVIATLLVPLNFLVMAGLPRLEEGASIVDLIIQVGSLALFVWLMHPTSKVLVPSAGWWLPLAVAGASAGQLLVPRVLDRFEVHEWKVPLLGGLPLLCSLAAMGGLLWRLNRAADTEASPTQQRSRQMLAYLGMSCFALAVAIGFLVYWTGGSAEVWQLLSPVLALAALPALAGGLVVSREAAGRPSVGVPAGSGDPRRALDPLQALALSGTAIMLAAVGIMLLAVAAAWPEPRLLICVCAVNVVVLTFVALRFDRPVLQAGALACFVLGYVVALNLYTNNLDTPFHTAIIHALRSALTGQGLAPLVVVLLIAAEVLVRWGRPAHAVHYLIAAGLLTAWSVAVINMDVTNVEDLKDEEIKAKALWAALVHALYAVTVVVTQVRVRRAVLVYLAAVLSQVALWHVLYGQDLQWRLTFVLLILSSIAALAVLLLTLLRARLDDRLYRKTAEPSTWVAVLASVIALLPLGVALSWHKMPTCAICYAWLALIWTALGFVLRRAVIFTAVQLALAVALVCSITAWLQVESWYDVRQPHALHSYGVGLALFCLSWLALRLAVVRREELHELLDPHLWPAPDRVFLALLVIGQLLLALWGLIPGLQREFTAGDPAAIDWTDARLQALDRGAWLLLGVLFVVVTVSLWERERATGLIRLMLLGCTVPILIAALYRDENACASGWRWGAGGMFALLSGLLWLRVPIVRSSGRVHIGERVTFPPLVPLRIILFLGTFVPVLILTWVIAQEGFAKLTPAGPDASSIFARLGWVTSNVIPLGVLAAVLVGHALRERSAGFAFSAGLLTLVTLVGGYALGRVLEQGTLTLRNEIEMLQLGTLVAGAWAYVWLVSRRWLATWAERPDAPLAAPLMLVQVSMGMLGNLVLLVTALVCLLVNLPLHHPTHPLTALPQVPLWTLAAGTWLGWAALVATWLPILHILRRQAPSCMVHGLGGLGLLLGILICCTMSDFDATGGWVAHHVLTVSWSALGALLLGAAWTGTSIQQIGPILWGPERRAEAARTLHRWFAPLPSRIWVQAIALAVLLLALRGTWGDPSRPYWSAGATLAASALIGLLAIWSRSGLLVYGSGLLVNIVGMLVWQAWLVDEVGIVTWMSFSPGMFDRFLYINLLCLAVSAGVWCGIEHWSGRADGGSGGATWLPAWLPRYSRVAPSVALNGMLVLVLMGLASDLVDRDLSFGGQLSWVTFAFIVAAIVAGLWDLRYRLTLAELFVAGLTGLGLLLHGFHLQPVWLGWWGTLVIAAYLFIVSSALGGASRLNVRRQSRGWILPAQAALGGLALALSIWMATSFERFLDRTAGPLVVALLGGAITLQWRRRTMPAVIRKRGLPITLIVGLAIFLCEVGWSCVDPKVPAPWLQRLAVLLVVLVGMAELCLSLPPRLGPIARDWIGAARRGAAVFAAAASAVLLVFLVRELVLFDADTKYTPLLPVLVALSAAATALLIAVVIRLAVVPGLDPFRLSEGWRTLYVYLAELLLLCLLLHVRLNVPWLFGDVMRKYWTFAIIGLAYVGVGLAEWLHRRGLNVLAWPLFNTGLVLPFIPIVVFWVIPATLVSQVAEEAPGVRPLARFAVQPDNPFLRHSAHWLLVAAMFAMIAALRRRFIFAFLAALFLNFALWSLWGHLGSDFAFLLHPQIWLVPLALILLISEHVHRDHLSTVQATTLRNAALLLLYVSSTADMFIAGLGNSVWLPILLALLAVAGVLLGILLRVRAFLFQGVAFLFVVVLAQIWHAAVDRQQTWVWWASGIVLGAAIITLFAIFEKRKQDVVKLVEELKEWR